MEATEVGVAETVRVKVADYVVRQGATVISTIGLGSCVAIALYDPDSRVGGLAHILLPNTSRCRAIRATRPSFRRPSCR